MVSLPLEQSTVSVSHRDLCLSLTPGDFIAHKAGIEFHCDQALPCFSMLELTVQAPGAPVAVTASGVVVACEPCDHQRFRATVLFLDLPQEGAGG